VKRVHLVLALAVAIVTQAQAPVPTLREETAARGYWVDPATNLMWAGTDNGDNIKWGKAIQYCRDSRLAGYSNWTLPGIVELESLDRGKDSIAPPEKPGVTILKGGIKGGIRLTGARQWSMDRVLDLRGKNSGYGLEYDYFLGGRWEDPLGYSGQLRALCVRQP
jgi:hypothetical protein